MWAAPIVVCTSAWLAPPAKNWHLQDARYQIEPQAYPPSDCKATKAQDSRRSMVSRHCRADPKPCRLSMSMKAYNVLQSHQPFPLHRPHLAVWHHRRAAEGTQQYGNIPRPCLPSMALSMTFCQALTVSTELTTVERPHLPWQGGRHEALSSADSEHCRGSTVGSCGSCLHGSNLLLGGETALDAGAYFCIRFSALIPDRLLKSAPLPLLTIPAHIAQCCQQASNALHMLFRLTRQRQS